MKQNELTRIRWHCRRGMLELDVLLQGFFDHCYEKLEPQQQSQFQTLLNEQDVYLYAWLLGTEQSPNEFTAAIELIRAYAAAVPRN
jgi:antitoxin CptB